MKRFFLIISIFTSFIILTSCASKQIEKRERSETFIADINSFEIGTVHLYTTITAFGKPKISDFNIYFSPRTNYVFAKAKIGIDLVQIGFSYEERQKLNQAKEIYFFAYENNTIQNAKPTKKNSISQGNASVEWGSFGLSHEVMTTYMTNTQYLEPDKPYFRIKFIQKEEEQGDNVKSPALCIYISPSQWKKIVEVCNQEHLVEMTDEILAQAEAF